MGHTTSISDYELERGDGPPPCEGVDIEVSHGKSNAPKEHMSESEIRGDFDDPDLEEEPKTKAKVVTAKEKKPPVTATAETKSK
jgi:hypothetical protein